MNSDLKLCLAQAELNRLNHGIDHTLAVVVQGQYIGAGGWNLQCVMGEVTGVERSLDRMGGLPDGAFNAPVDHHGPKSQRYNSILILLIFFVKIFNYDMQEV